MKQTLRNDLLTVVVDSHGAELQSIVDNRTGHEYLWQADKAFWGRRSPVLFPIVGAVWNGTFTMDGREYRMGQHGFARDCDFTVMEGAPDDEAWFALEASEGTMAMYPRRFRLETGYALQGERLTVMWRVHNLDSRDMYFQIGAHPAFNLPAFSAADPVHGYLMCDRRSGLRAEVIAEKGCVGAVETDVVTDDSGMIPIEARTFAHDAIILDGQGVGRVSLLDKERSPYLSMFFDAPLVGLWAPKPDAPFVCIEPWWGRCDRTGCQGEFAAREHVNRLEPGARFDASYMVIFENL